MLCLQYALANETQGAPQHLYNHVDQSHDRPHLLPSSSHLTADVHKHAREGCAVLFVLFSCTLL